MATITHLLAPRYAAIETPAGPAWFAYTADGVALLETNVSERSFVSVAGERFGSPPVRRDPPPAMRRKIQACIESGDGSVVDWSWMPAFQSRVLKGCARIPRGRAVSYGDLARMIGAPNAQRAVGTALARNPVPLLVPCHRVVRSDGKLGNYGMGGEAAKRALLEREGFTARGSAQ